MTIQKKENNSLALSISTAKAVPSSTSLRRILKSTLPFAAMIVGLMGGTAHKAWAAEITREVIKTADYTIGAVTATGTDTFVLGQDSDGGLTNSGNLSLTNVIALPASATNYLTVNLGRLGKLSGIKTWDILTWTGANPSALAEGNPFLLNVLNGEGYTVSAKVVTGAIRLTVSGGNPNILTPDAIGFNLGSAENGNVLFRSITGKGAIIVVADSEIGGGENLTFTGTVTVAAGKELTLSNGKSLVKAKGITLNSGSTLRNAEFSRKQLTVSSTITVAGGASSRVTINGGDAPSSALVLEGTLPVPLPPDANGVIVVPPRVAIAGAGTVVIDRHVMLNSLVASTVTVNVGSAGYLVYGGTNAKAAATLLAGNVTLDMGGTLRGSTAARLTIGASKTTITSNGGIFDGGTSGLIVSKAIILGSAGVSISSAVTFNAASQVSGAGVLTIPSSGTLIAGADFGAKGSAVAVHNTGNLDLSSLPSKGTLSVLGYNGSGNIIVGSKAVVAIAANATKKIVASAPIQSLTVTSSMYDFTKAKFKFRPISGGYAVGQVLTVVKFTGNFDYTSGGFNADMFNGQISKIGVAKTGPGVATGAATLPELAALQVKLEAAAKAFDAVNSSSTAVSTTLVADKAAIITALKLAVATPTPAQLKTINDAKTVQAAKTAAKAIVAAQATTTVDLDPANTGTVTGTMDNGGYMSIMGSVHFAPSILLSGAGGVKELNFKVTKVDSLLTAVIPKSLTVGPDLRAAAITTIDAATADAAGVTAVGSALRSGLGLADGAAFSKELDDAVTAAKAAPATALAALKVLAKEAITKTVTYTLLDDASLGTVKPAALLLNVAATSNSVLQGQKDKSLASTAVFALSGIDFAKSGQLNAGAASIKVTKLALGTNAVTINNSSTDDTGLITIVSLTGGATAALTLNGNVNIGVAIVQPPAPAAPIAPIAASAFAGGVTVNAGAMVTLVTPKVLGSSATSVITLSGGTLMGNFEGPNKLFLTAGTTSYLLGKDYKFTSASADGAAGTGTVVIGNGGIKTPTKVTFGAATGTWSGTWKVTTGSTLVTNSNILAVYGEIKGTSIVTGAQTVTTASATQTVVIDAAKSIDGLATPALIKAELDKLVGVSTIVGSTTTITLPTALADLVTTATTAATTATTTVTPANTAAAATALANLKAATKAAIAKAAGVFVSLDGGTLDFNNAAPGGSFAAGLVLNENSVSTITTSKASAPANKFTMNGTVTGTGTLKLSSKATFEISPTASYAGTGQLVVLGATLSLMTPFSGTVMVDGVAKMLAPTIDLQAGKLKNGTAGVTAVAIDVQQIIVNTSAVIIDGGTGGLNVRGKIFGAKDITVLGKVNLHSDSEYTGQVVMVSDAKGSGNADLGLGSNSALGVDPAKKITVNVAAGNATIRDVSTGSAVLINRLVTANLTGASTLNLDKATDAQAADPETGVVGSKDGILGDTNNNMKFTGAFTAKGADGIVEVKGGTAAVTTGTLAAAILETSVTFAGLTNMVSLVNKGTVELQNKLNLGTPAVPPSLALPAGVAGISGSLTATKIALETVRGPMFVITPGLNNVLIPYFPEQAAVSARTGDALAAYDKMTPAAKKVADDAAKKTVADNNALVVKAITTPSIITIVNTGKGKSTVLSGFRVAVKPASGGLNITANSAINVLSYSGKVGGLTELPSMLSGAAEKTLTGVTLAGGWKQLTVTAAADIFTVYGGFSGYSSTMGYGASSPLGMSASVFFKGGTGAATAMTDLKIMLVFRDMSSPFVVRTLTPAGGGLPVAVVGGLAALVGGTAVSVTAATTVADPFLVGSGGGTIDGKGFRVTLNGVISGTGKLTLVGRTTGTDLVPSVASEFSFGATSTTPYASANAPGSLVKIANNATLDLTATAATVITIGGYSGTGTIKVPNPNSTPTATILAGITINAATDVNSDFSGSTISYGETTAAVVGTSILGASGITIATSSTGKAFGGTVGTGSIKVEANNTSKYYAAQYIWADYTSAGVTLKAKAVADVANTALVGGILDVSAALSITSYNTGSSKSGTWVFHHTPATTGTTHTLPMLSLAPTADLDVTGLNIRIVTTGGTAALMFPASGPKLPVAITENVEDGVVLATITTAFGFKADATTNPKGVLGLAFNVETMGSGALGFQAVLNSSAAEITAAGTTRAVRKNQIVLRAAITAVAPPVSTGGSGDAPKSDTSTPAPVGNRGIGTAGAGTVDGNGTSGKLLTEAAVSLLDLTIAATNDSLKAWAQIADGATLAGGTAARTGTPVTLGSGKTAPTSTDSNLVAADLAELSLGGTSTGVTVNGGAGAAGLTIGSKLSDIAGAKTFVKTGTVTLTGLVQMLGAMTVGEGAALAGATAFNTDTHDPADSATVIANPTLVYKNTTGSMSLGALTVTGANVVIGDGTISNNEVGAASLTIQNGGLAGAARVSKVFVRGGSATGGKPFVVLGALTLTSGELHLRRQVEAKSYVGPTAAPSAFNYGMIVFYPHATSNTALVAYKGATATDAALVVTAAPVFTNTAFKIAPVSGAVATPAIVAATGLSFLAVTSTATLTSANLPTAGHLYTSMGGVVATAALASGNKGIMITLKAGATTAAATKPGLIVAAAATSLNTAFGTAIKYLAVNNLAESNGDAGENVHNKVFLSNAALYTDQAGYQLSKVLAQGAGMGGTVLGDIYGQMDATNQTDYNKFIHQLSGVQNVSNFNSVSRVANLSSNVVNQRLAAIQSGSDLGNNNNAGFNLSKGSKSVSDFTSDLSAAGLASSSIDNAKLGTWMKLSHASIGKTHNDVNLMSGGNDLIQMGYDMKVSDDFTLGFTAAYADATSSTKGETPSSLNLRNTTVGTYGAWTAGDFGIDFTANVNRGNATNTRFIGAVDQSGNANSQYHFNGVSSAARIGYELGKKGEYSMRPFIGMDYSHMKSESFKETGSMTWANLAVKAMSEEQSHVTVGFDSRTTFETETGTITPRLSLGWKHLVTSAEQSQTMALAADNTVQFNTANTNKLTRDAAVIGTGIDMRLSDNFAMYGDYSNTIDSRNGAQQQSLMLGGKWGF